MSNLVPVDDRELIIKEGPVLLDLCGHVGRLQLNRPESANGLSMEMLEGLHAALKRCIGEPRIRVVLLSGCGVNFCGGGDVHEFASKGDGLPNHIRRATALLQEVIGALIHLDAPVVAAVQGYAAGGGGMGLVCACDLVIAAQSARFLTGATRVGMAPDAGLSVTLPRLIGARKATELLLMNSIVTASEALILGLVNQVVPDAKLAATSLAYAQKPGVGSAVGTGGYQATFVGRGWRGGGGGDAGGKPNRVGLVPQRRCTGRAGSRHCKTVGKILR